MGYVIVEKSFPLERVSCVPADLLEEMLSIIHENLPQEKVTHQLIFRSKYILTELITNALKHANSHKASLNLELSDSKVRFIKTDDGNKLNIPTEYDEYKAGYIVTNDVMHTLYTVDKEDKMFFYCQENNEPVFDVINAMPEHFGLLIITKASDEFYYFHESGSNLNTFCVTINL